MKLDEGLVYKNVKKYDYSFTGIVDSRTQHNSFQIVGSFFGLSQYLAENKDRQIYYF